jgi:hypothetical protein
MPQLFYILAVPPSLSLTVAPQLVANPGIGVLADVAREPGRWAIEPKVDGIRCLLAYLPDTTIETRNRRSERRDWLRHPSLAYRVPSRRVRPPARFCPRQQASSTS